MKKLIAMLLVVVLALGLFAGCANNDSGKETTAAKTPDETKAPETTAAPAATTKAPAATPSTADTGISLVLIAAAAMLTVAAVSRKGKN